MHHLQSLLDENMNFELLPYYGQSVQSDVSVGHNETDPQDSIQIII